MNFPEVTLRVIELAREIREYYDIELPQRHPNYPLVGADEESAPAPPAELELLDFLARLPEERIYQLLLLMHLGRGDFDAEDLPGYSQALKGTYGDSSQAISQLMLFKGTLADELSDGLEEAREHHIDMDRMLSKKSKVRKR